MEVRAKLAAAYAPLNPPQSIQILQTRTELDSLARAWDALARRNETPMQHHIWAQAGAQTLADNGLLIVVAQTAQSFVAIAPLQGSPGWFAPLRLLGQAEMLEPMDLLYADDAALGSLAAGLAQLGAALWLERLPADSPALAALQRAYRWRGYVHVSAAPGYPYIELTADWREPERCFNSGRRSDFRRMRRLAEGLGALRFEILAPTVAELPPLLAAAYRVEAACWKGAEGSALARDAVRGEFFRHYAAAASQQGILRLCFLRIGEQLAAMQLAVECGERFWLLKIGYDEQFARCSPGSLLMLETLRYAAARGLRSYEFLGSAQPWTAHWTQTQRACAAVRAYSYSPRALATLAYDAARWAGERLRHLVGRAA